MDDLNSYMDRLESAFTTTMRKLRPELIEGMESSLTGPQFFILHLLSKKEKCMVTELADSMGVKPSGITVMIDRLCQNGLVRRERDEKDRRIVYTLLTEQGRETLKQAEENRKEVIKKYLQHLSQEELESLVSIYEKLARITTEKRNDGN
ncbi:MarR family winged helix-turn-helix transcriptional regulator [Aneurinibacillus tyrosinisolvens]|uniref:MarR family winged helix-turn-helix transcriptional regulator n=1 Tax=Aneurinibacillus tyrosinisolvens TaxID=1443435 RepID=UPI00063F199C|nr:MarR family transcriptional regulator [Aneurinibacillus tyrosinisolvens]